MNKYITNIVLGILLIFIPLLGFPISYIKFFVILVGLIIAFTSFFIYREEAGRRPKGRTEIKKDTFVDNLSEK